MPPALIAAPPPLTLDGTGTIRAGGKQIATDFVLSAHRAGLTPEQIAGRYESLQLADSYGATGYALRHRAEIDAYLARREAEATALKAAILANQRPFPTKAERLARKAAGGDG